MINFYVLTDEINRKKPVNNRLLNSNKFNMSPVKSYRLEISPEPETEVETFSGSP